MRLWAYRTQAPQTCSRSQRGWTQHGTVHQDLLRVHRTKIWYAALTTVAPTSGGVGQGLMGGGDQNKGWHPSGLGDGSNTELEKRHKFKSIRHFGLKNKLFGNCTISTTFETLNQVCFSLSSLRGLPLMRSPAIDVNGINNNITGGKESLFIFWQPPFPDLIFCINSKYFSCRMKILKLISKLC